MRSLHQAMLCLLALAIIISAPAYADPPWKHSENGKTGRSIPSLHAPNDKDDAAVTIASKDRDYIRDYIRYDYKKKCPPGLAKKRNGCLPPGQAKKYAIGSPLPEGAAFKPVPDELLIHLNPVPMGYRYVRIDRDILLIAEATKKVVDAVTLLSAVGK